MLPFIPKTNWQFNEVLTEKDMNRIESGITESKQQIEAHLADHSNPHAVTAAQTGAIPTSAIGAANGVATLDAAQRLSDSQVPERLNNFSKYASLPDANGQYTRVELKRADGTLYMRSTASNPDANLNYRTITWDFYNTAGTDILSTQTWTLNYDANNKIVSEVLS